MINDLRNKILSPFLQISGLPQDAQKKIEKIYLELVVQKLILAIFNSLDPDEKLEFTQKLEKVTQPDLQIKIFGEFIANKPKVDKAVEEFLATSLPQFIEDTIGAFVKSASDKQKKEFLKLLQKAGEQ